MPTLSLSQRARVAARVLLTRVLGLVPESVVPRVRQWCQAHPGTAADAVLAVARHRSIAGLGSFTVTGDPSGAQVMLEASDSKVLRRLYWLGVRGHEEGEADVWRAACRDASRVVEIGANVGYYTVVGAAANPAATYLSVEANPESAALVRRNVELNDLRNVEILNAAAVRDDSTPSVELALPDQERYAAPTGAFLARDTEGVYQRRAASRRVTVAARGARALVQDADLVKMDIEGAEHLVLEAAMDLLLANGAVLFVEVLRDTPHLRAQLTEMLSAGFEGRVLTPGSGQVLQPADLTTHDLKQTFGVRDVVLGPPERLSRIFG